LNQDAYRKLVSGESGGPCAALVRLTLGIAAQAYRVIVCLRNLLYSKGWFKIHRAEVPVISVGNITTGGTGKTPLVIWLCNKIISDSQFQVSNSQCAILTRGYKAIQDSQSGIQNFRDEPAILAESCPEVQVIVNPDRVAGAAEAINKFSAVVLIMDDGFQHRRLARDLDIVTIDGTLPFGYGKLLPAGLLREPVAALKRADAAVITRCDQATEDELTQLEDRLRQINPEMVIARSVHAPVCAKTIDNREISLEELKNKKIFAFCGIGNPDAFLNTVKGLGTMLAGSKVYNDHYHYTYECVDSIYEQAKNLNADLILTTQKDWVSFSTSAIPNASGDVNCAYLLVELRFVSGEKEITQLIKDRLAGKI
jgi:tetraacyldisaccharide 4'-kinase